MKQNIEEENGSAIIVRDSEAREEKDHNEMIVISVQGNKTEEERDYSNAGSYNNPSRILHSSPIIQSA